jgi:choline dehydrogenase-like flavoprotein
LGLIDWHETFQPGSGWEQSVSDIYHLMGGTRMSSEPCQGVVDQNLQVHGVDNLFVASCSVFPTGGSSNPTLTLMMLTLRLADKLINK